MNNQDGYYFIILIADINYGDLNPKCCSRFLFDIYTYTQYIKIKLACFLILSRVTRPKIY